MKENFFKEEMPHISCIDFGVGDILTVDKKTRQTATARMHYVFLSSVSPLAQRCDAKKGG